MIDGTVALLQKEFHSVNVTIEVHPPRTYGMTFTILPLLNKVWAIAGNGVPVTPEPVAYESAAELIEYIRGFVQ